MKAAGAVFRLAPACAVAFAAALGLGACAGEWTAPKTSGSLERPAKVFVDHFEAAPGTFMIDPGLGVQLKKRMSGLTDQAVAIETARRVGVVFTEQMIASLRSAGLPADIGTANSMLANTSAVLVEGTIRMLDEDTMRQRRQSGFGGGRIRILAEARLVYRANIDQKPLFNFTAEDPGAPTARAAQAGAGERLSADVEAHVRRVAQAAAERIVSYAAEQRWIRGPAAPASAPPPTPPARRR